MYTCFVFLSFLLNKSSKNFSHSILISAELSISLLSIYNFLTVPCVVFVFSRFRKHLVGFSPLTLTILTCFQGNIVYFFSPFLNPSKTLLWNNEFHISTLPLTWSQNWLLRFNSPLTLISAFSLNTYSSLQTSELLNFQRPGLLWHWLRFWNEHKTGAWSVLIALRNLSV